MGAEKWSNKTHIDQLSDLNQMKQQQLVTHLIDDPSLVLLFSWTI